MFEKLLFWKEHGEMCNIMHQINSYHCKQHWEITWSAFILKLFLSQLFIQWCKVSVKRKNVFYSITQHFKNYFNYTIYLNEISSKICSLSEKFISKMQTKIQRISFCKIKVTVRVVSHVKYMTVQWILYKKYNHIFEEVAVVNIWRGDIWSLK